MAAENITLDPSDLSTRTPIDITPWVAQEGIDWGDAAMTAYVAELEIGSTPVDFRIPNRAVSIPLVLKTVGGTSFATARSAIQTRIGVWQGQGGYLRRIDTSGGTVFFDVVTAQLHLGGDWLQAHSDADTNAAITLECLPDAYEAEETLSDHTETTLPEITFTETTANGGDFPLGDRVRIVVDDDQAQTQRGLFWHFRSRYYSSASTAASAYEAEALGVLDTATKVAKVGASGGTVITHGTLATYWLPVVSGRIGGTTYPTHTGTNRVYARVFGTAGTAISTRIVWDVNDLVYPTENDPVRLYDGGTFCIVDLGEVRLDPPPTGTYRWDYAIQAKADTAAVPFSVDRVWIVNSDESSGVLRALSAPTTSTTASPAIRDDFTGSAQNLDAPRTATLGGNWGESTRVGAAGFNTDGAGICRRTQVSDTNAFNGSFAFLGSSIAAQAASVDLKFSALPGGTAGYGLLLRYTDASNYVSAAIVPSASGYLQVYKYAAGSFLQLGATALSSFFGQINTYYTLMATIDAAGNWAMYWNFTGSAVVLALSGSDSSLATGGTLASGKLGLYDAHAVATVSTRTYDNFSGWSGTPDAVCFASQSVELQTAGNFREDAGGTALGPVSYQTGDLARMPNRSSAGTVEFMGKMTRGDLIQQSDPGIDDISARVFRRASHLLLPN